MPMNSKIWAIVQFKPNAHKLAEHNLNKQGFETFLPCAETRKYRNKQFISTQRPLFPGYMFVAFEKQNTPWHKINCTYGVSKLLTLNNEPYLVSNNLMAHIMARYNQEGVLLPQKQFSKDDNVRLISGPFDNFLAKVESIEENQRVWILIDLMGQATRTLVNAEKLKHTT
ncbi:transcriptional activator RfaH [Amylibacter sp.]|nr:transcriptional activator RfaH [Amylibacter sp.]